MNSSRETTIWLQRFRNGEPGAEKALFDLLFKELRRRAGMEMARERKEHTLQPSALVNEAYMRLIDQRDRNWENRSHFLSVASQVMRRVLIDHARQRIAQKRTAGHARVELEDHLLAVTPDPEQLIFLESALTRLAEFDPRQAQVVEMRFFGGLTEDEIAQTLKLSSRTVKRDWNMAKSWLYAELSGKQQSDPRKT